MTLEFHYSLPVHSYFEVYSFSALCQDSEKGAIHAIMGMLSSSVKPWHCAAAELIGRLIINPDNEPFLLPIIPQVNVFFWNSITRIKVSVSQIFWCHTYIGLLDADIQTTR
jgi:hypothetical protein